MSRIAFCWKHFFIVFLSMCFVFQSELRDIRQFNTVLRPKIVSCSAKYCDLTLFYFREANTLFVIKRVLDPLIFVALSQQKVSHAQPCYTYNTRTRRVRVYTSAYQGHVIQGMSPFLNKALDSLIQNTIFILFCHLPLHSM